MSEVKPMRYTTHDEFEILMNGNYCGVPFWVISYGTHPCVYVDVTAFGKSLDVNEIDCHGGITYDEHDLRGVYDESMTDFIDGSRRFIGWDYAHGGDYYGGDSISEHGHKYTTDEMVDDAVEVIDQLHTMKIGITEEDRTELIKEFFTDIIRGAENDIRENAFENIDEELLTKYGIIEAGKLLNFDSFIDVIKIGVREKYGVEIDLD